MKRHYIDARITEIYEGTHSLSLSLSLSLSVSLSFYISLFFSLSLSLTHTHAHTHRIRDRLPRGEVLQRRAHHRDLRRHKRDPATRHRGQHSQGVRCLKGKLQLPFAKDPYKNRALSQKRPLSLVQKFPKKIEVVPRNIRCLNGKYQVSLAKEPYKK